VYSEWKKLLFDVYASLGKLHSGLEDLWTGFERVSSIMP